MHKADKTGALIREGLGQNAEREAHAEGYTAQIVCNNRVNEQAKHSHELNPEQAMNRELDQHRIQSCYEVISFLTSKYKPAPPNNLSLQTGS